VEAAVAEVHVFGFEAFFSNFTAAELRELVEEAGLEANSSSKTILQRCLIYGDNYHVSVCYSLLLSLPPLIFVLF